MIDKFYVRVFVPHSVQVSSNLASSRIAVASLRKS